MTLVAQHHRIPAELVGETRALFLRYLASTKEGYGDKGPLQAQEAAACLLVQVLLKSCFLEDGNKEGIASCVGAGGGIVGLTADLEPGSRRWLINRVVQGMNDALDRIELETIAPAGEA